MTQRFAVLSLLATAACGLPSLHGRGSYAAPITTVANDSSPIVQVRQFAQSAVISVFAWDQDEVGVGLSTSIYRSTGAIVGGKRSGDHRLYMSDIYTRQMGGFTHATDAAGHLLLGTGVERDIYSCFYGDRCSPMVTVGVRIPDSLARASRDSLVITFHRPAGEPWTVTLRGALVNAFLATTDSLRTQVLAESR